VIKDIPIGVYAKNTYPKKTDKSIGVGEVGVPLDFETMIIKMGTWIYVDTNGWVISEKELEI
jgi:regulator of ribonuclease activity A